MELPSLSRIPRNRARSFGIPLLGRVAHFLTSLSEGDKAIAGFLGFLIVITSMVAVFALVRTLQVTVPSYGGTLYEGTIGSPRFVNPLLATSDSDRDVVALTYAGLMGHDKTGALVPVLAEKYTVSGDGTVYTFTLREGAEFSDGTPVSADDVLYTAQKAQDPALKSPVYASWSNIRAEAVDARTVQFTLPKPYAPFLEVATLGILPQHIWKGISDEQFPFSPYQTLPIAAGPFIANSVTQDAQGVITGYKLSAFKNYALGKPYLANIHFSFFGSQASLSKALSNGSVTSAYGITGDHAHTTPYARVIAVFFNPEKNAALKDIHVRKALSETIDRDALVRDALGGYATATTGPLPGQKSLVASTTNSTREDLESAGYTYASSTQLWVKGGEPLSITLETSNVPELKAVAEAIRKDWTTLGVKTTLELHDPSELSQNVIRPRAYSALLFGEVIGTNPDLYAFWAGSERADPGLNIADYENTTVDSLLEKARIESNGNARAQTLLQASEKIANDYPAAFLYTPDLVYTLPSSIKGATFNSVSSPSDRFWDISHWYMRVEHVWPYFANRR